jgi:hypothetical protein
MVAIDASFVVITAAVAIPTTGIALIDWRVC